jgi:hypothetical protein
MHISERIHRMDIALPERALEASPVSPKAAP